SFRIGPILGEHIRLAQQALGSPFAGAASVIAGPDGAFQQSSGLLQIALDKSPHVFYTAPRLLRAVQPRRHAGEDGYALPISTAALAHITLSKVAFQLEIIKGAEKIRLSTRLIDSLRIPRLGEILGIKVSGIHQRITVLYPRIERLPGAQHIRVRGRHIGG